MANCSQTNNTTIIGTSAVSYDSTPLPCTDVKACDDLNTILTKFDNVICSAINSVNILSEEVMNITEDLMIITEEIENINDQIFICCPICDFTITATELPVCDFTGSVNQVPDPTTTTTSSSTSTSTSTSSTTTTTTTTLNCCTPFTNLELPGDTILLDGVNLTFSSTQPAGLSIWTPSTIMFPACLPSQTLNTVLTGGLSGDTDWDYTINFDQPVNNVKIQVINYSASSFLQNQEQITFTTNTDVPQVINCDSCDVIIESNSIKSVIDTNGSGTFIISATTPYTSLTLTPTMLGVNPGGDEVTVFLRICGFTSPPTTSTTTSSSSTSTSSSTTTTTTTVFAYCPTSVLSPITPYYWKGLTTTPDGTVYGCTLNGLVWQYPVGGPWSSVSVPDTLNAAIAADSLGNVYAAKFNGNIFVKLFSASYFIGISPTPGYLPWTGLFVDQFDTLWAIDTSGNIYTKASFTNIFAYHGPSIGGARDITVAPNGDIYVCTNSFMLKQTGGVGAFVPLSTSPGYWTSISAAPNGDIICVGEAGFPPYVGGAWVIYAGTDTFVKLPCASDSDWESVHAIAGGKFYAGQGISDGQVHIFG